MATFQVIPPETSKTRKKDLPVLIIQTGIQTIRIKQVNTLLYAMGEETDEIFSSFSDCQTRKNTVKAKFESHLF